MGADKKSNLSKCGEILINIKTKHKKNKLYSFNCAFCNTNCDQLKKFSLHLEENHFGQLTDEKSSLIFNEPEIKLEEHLEINTTYSLKNDDVKDAKHIKSHDDPLETVNAFVTSPSTHIEELLEAKVKIEDVQVNCTELLKEDNDNFNKDEIDFEDYFEENSDDEYKPPIKKENKKFNHTKNNKNVLSESSSDEISDDEYQPLIKKEKKKFNNAKKKKNISSELSSDESSDAHIKIKDIKTKEKCKRKSKKCELDINVDEKDFIKALFESFEKETKLWNLNERTHDANICKEGFEKIANEVNSKFNTNITWHLAKTRINAMRIEYAYELEKQRKGQEHKIPWYYEHMKYLQDNIEHMLKERKRKQKRKLTHLDHSLLPIFIQLYKKHEDLWQVNSIRFGNPMQRDKIFNTMIVDLKSNHNLDINVDYLHEYIKYINCSYSKDKEMQLICELEKSEFKPSSQYYNEMSFLSESQGPFKCITCNEIIDKYENYHLHVANHNKTKPFKCLLCEKDFKNWNTLIRHNRRHLGSNRYPCTFCNKTFPYMGELGQHLLGHTGEKPYLCQVCGIRFRNQRQHADHLRCHEKQFRYECHICKLGFNRPFKLKEHVKNHLKIRDIVCDICGKGFTCKRYLSNHKLIHADKKRYKCDICGKEFAQGPGYRAHCKQHLTADKSEINKQAFEKFLNL